MSLKYYIAEKLSAHTTYTYMNIKMNWIKRMIAKRMFVLIHYWSQIYTELLYSQKRYIISNTVKPTFPSQRHFIHPLILKPLLIIHETFKIIIFYNPRDFTANLSMFTFCGFTQRTPENLLLSISVSCVS